MIWILEKQFIYFFKNKLKYIMLRQHMKTKKYRVHRFDLNMKEAQIKLEQFLNNLEGEVVSIVPNVGPLFLCYGSKVNFLLIVEKLK